MCGLIFSTTLSDIFFTLRRIERGTIRNVKYPLFLSVSGEANSEEAFTISWRTIEYHSGSWFSSQNSKSERYQYIWEWNA